MSTELTKHVELNCDYERYEGRMEHEDMLISQRISWLVSSQAFLLSPYVLLHDNPTVPGISTIEYVIVAVGVVTVALTYISVAAGIHAMLRLKYAYDNYIDGREPLAAFKPLIDLSRIDSRQGLLAPRGLIYCFFVSWLVLLSISLKSDHYLKAVGWGAAAMCGALGGLALSLVGYAIDRAAIDKVQREAES